jgi:exopolysaccharide biosynthesis polyprenyl glycosylphosphotransferase
MLQRSSARYVIALYLADLTLTVCALFIARWARMLIQYGKSLDVGGSALSWPMFVLAAMIWSVTLSAFKAYNPQRFTHAIDELQVAVAAITVATLIFAGTLYFSYRGLSRLLYVYFYILDIILCLSARIVLRKLLGNRRSAYVRGVLVIGTGALGQSITDALEPCAWMGIEVKGYLDVNPDQVGQVIGKYPVLGTLEQASEVIAQHAIREVVIALPLDAHTRLANLVAALQALPVNIKIVPDYSSMVFFRATLEQLGDVFLFGLKEPVIGPIDRIIKRLFDLTLAVLGLIALSPLLGVIALGIVLSSPGPALYKSRRVGEDGRPFEMLKFRTMVQDADKREAEMVSETAEGKLIFDKRKDDPRITPLGRFLRRYSLDEFPQLYNVLIGEMSLVGPRPELPSLVDRYEPWQRKRFGVPQGMTGWWQISGRGNKAKYLHVEDDLYYIQNYSLLLDVTILWRTLGAVLKGDGAF